MRMSLPDIHPVASIPGTTMRAGGESRLDIFPCSRLGNGRGLMVMMLMGLGRMRCDGEDTVLIAREDLPLGNDVCLAYAGEGMAKGGIGGINVFGNLSLDNEVAGGLLPGQELGQSIDSAPTPQAVLPGPGADGGGTRGDRRTVVDKDNVRHFLFGVVSSALSSVLPHTLSLSFSLFPRPDTRQLTGAVNEPTALTRMEWEMGDGH
jgi:hypothetical protein